jgi:predicted GNAT family acetyltransferase
MKINSLLDDCLCYINYFRREMYSVIPICEHKKSKIEKIPDAEYERHWDQFENRNSNQTQ